MISSQIASPLFRLEKGAAPIETIRRVETFLETLAALPKPSWRPQIDARGIRQEGPGLERVRRLLDALGDPSAGRTVIRVVGTSGKGSTALMIAEALHAAGLRTAAFFSPHLTTLIERFWMEGRFLDADAAGRAAARIADVASEMMKDPAVGPPSYFEGTMAILLLAAAEADCSHIVLEAGLGGTYDATNAVAPGALEVIAPIGLDHTDLLGDSVEQIARDKAGIITPGGHVIMADSPAEARAEIERAARERGATLFSSPEVRRLAPEEEGSTFDITFNDGARWERVRCRMAGAHQAGNAALAAGACRLLGLDEKSVRAGIGAARLPGRIERMPGAPVVLDGAHNRDKARALRDALEAWWPGRRRVFVLAAIGDKDHRGLAEALVGAGDRFIATLPPPGTPRPPLAPEVFAESLKGAGAAHVSVDADSQHALEEAVSAAGGDGLVVVAGSLYLAGALRRRWYSEEAIVRSGSAYPEEGER